ncbi:exonuclease N-terminus-domain-containing protein [Neocallimastix lanati (nom. inval.)]|nr:exonuclease N-terminus-domain-containing protein [Neocallimastix sp. JGI-2020a]
MGVPALFRYLTNKYPKLISAAIEETPAVVDGIEIPVDISKPNPNGFENDNLYLDMNGIVHPCTHPVKSIPPPPDTEEEMIIEVFKYVDRLMNMVRPRKLLYMAIDGVAPRAKMNQQRSRRFRSALDAKLKAEEEERQREEMEKHGETIIEPTKEKIKFDSNCITPGTPFMDKLSKYLKYYINDRLNNNPGWKGLKVILSDAGVPGEGEHKIMDFIRRQRNTEGYDPNTHHVMYGLDADLIMLSMATHEPHFKIIREDVFYQQTKYDVRNSYADPTRQDETSIVELPPKPFLFFHINILKEYLEAELKLDDLPFLYDVERIVDDWVFLCFFVGNDFLPHLPSLEIREGAIDTLVKIYKQLLPTFGDYITDSGEINLNYVKEIMIRLGELEDQVFRERRKKEKRYREMLKKRRHEQRLNEGQNKDDKNNKTNNNNNNNNDNNNNNNNNTSSSSSTKKNDLNNDDAPKVSKENNSLIDNSNSTNNKSTKTEEKEEEKKSPEEKKNDNLPELIELSATNPLTSNREILKRKKENLKAAAEQNRNIVALKRAQRLKSQAAAAAAESHSSVNNANPVNELIPLSNKRKYSNDDSSNSSLSLSTSSALSFKKSKVDEDESEDSEPEPEDNIRLWESGWKERYYKNKFGVEINDITFINKVVEAYTEGLCWVLKYYYQGCQSWNWYYPYHYSPFASDFANIKKFNVEFKLGEPFKPFEQLMGVLPAASNSHIPKPFRNLMTDPNSNIFEYYPEEFKIDLNGKKYSWQGVALLPFIDEKRLLSAMEPYYSQLTEEEKERNSRSCEILYVESSNPLYDTMESLYKDNSKIVELTKENSKNLNGSIESLKKNYYLPGDVFISPLKEYELPDLKDLQSIGVKYLNPTFEKGYVFKAYLLPNVELPAPVLTPEDAYWVRIGGKHKKNKLNMDASNRMMRNSFGSDFNRNNRNNYNNNYNNNNNYNRNGNSYNNRNDMTQMFYGDSLNNNNNNNNNNNSNNSNNNNRNNRRFNNRYRNYGGDYFNNNYNNNNNDNNNNNNYQVSRIKKNFFFIIYV